MKLETIKIGRIVNAHGIRGEVRVQPRDLDPHLLTGSTPSCWMASRSNPLPIMSTRAWC